MLKTELFFLLHLLLLPLPESFNYSISLFRLDLVLFLSIPHPVLRKLYIRTYKNLENDRNQVIRVINRIPRVLFLIFFHFALLDSINFLNEACDGF